MGSFGYSDSRADYFDSVHSWYKNRFNYDVKEEWLVKTPGIVFALATAIRAIYGKRGWGYNSAASVLSIFGLILGNKRRLINNPLIYKDDRYYIDFDDFEEKL